MKLTRLLFTSPQPKSDISDFGQRIVPNSGEPEFGRGEVTTEPCCFSPPQLHPVVPPQVSHFRQVPLRTRVKLPHSPQASPS